MIPGNSSPTRNYMSCCFPCCWCFPIFEVPANHFALVINETSEGKRTVFYGPGYHMLSYFNSLQGVFSFHKTYNNNIIESDIGDMKLVRVN